jgi:FlaA1/EpsC-like NDP-sugar epimerase
MVEAETSRVRPLSYHPHFEMKLLIRTTADLHPVLRAVGLCALYAAMTAGALFFAYLLRFDFNIPESFFPQMVRCLMWLIPVQLVMLWSLGQFKTLLSYFGIPDLGRLLVAVLVPCLCAGALWSFSGTRWAPPRSAIILQTGILFVALCLLRICMRLMRERMTRQRSSSRQVAKSRRVAIVGAGDSGAALAREMFGKRQLGLVPVAFLDDHPGKKAMRVHGIPILGRPEECVEELAELGAEEVIIAMPTASVPRVREIVSLMRGAGLKCEILPSMGQLMQGNVSVSHIRPVEIEDLLGRETVDLRATDIRAMLEGKTVLVTGAGGSIGSELCRQIARCAPKRLVLLEQCEVQMFAVEQELIEAGHGNLLVPVVADILDQPRMEAVFTQTKPQIVFHAAAHKHVPLMERQPVEALRNNTLGTLRTAENAARFGVERFVFISTDKAINPTNVMGATKRLAEIFLQALQEHDAHGMRLCAVRFGNVLGSSGSVVPTFRRQIARGGPVTVTHPEVTRYFMTIPEAVGLVLQAATQARGGDIFVLDMGDPVRIADLARQMIELSGLRPDVDIAVEFTGLRPGEKLYEEVAHHTENHEPTEHPQIMRFVSRPPDLAHVKQRMETLVDRALHLPVDEVKTGIQELVPEYKPYHEPVAKAGH